MAASPQIQSQFPRDNYVGDTFKQKRNGYGVYYYENKFFRYEGEWQNGKKHGSGKLIMNDGTYYQGEFKNGEIDGNGYKYFATSGNTYSGEFHMGELHGQGIMKYGDGSVYEGNWVRNCQQGYGIYRCSPSEIYKGYLHANKKHGEGTQIYSDGDRYDGEWVQGFRQGHGILYCHDGTVYEGQWLRDHFHGEGTMNHSSGMVYEGMWLNGKPAKLSHHLSVHAESPLEVTQGYPFSIEITCSSIQDSTVEDDGREIKLTCGVRIPDDKKTSDISVSGKSNSGLFETIEDLEHQTHSTPFGYDVISHPITDVYPGDDPEVQSLLGIKSEADLAESVVLDNPPADSTASISKSNELQRPDSPSNLSHQDSTVLELPPPIETKRTKNGIVSFQNLFLPSNQRISEHIKDDSSGSTAVSRVTPRTSRERLGDERFSKPGEYVIIVEDVTNPPFMGITLEPGYIIIKVVLPKKVKKKKGPSGSSSPGE